MKLWLSTLLFLSAVVLSFGLDVSYLNLQVKEKVPYVRDILEFPQYMDGKTLKDWLKGDQLPEGKLYIGNRPLTEKDLDRLVKSLNVEEVEDTVEVQFGWTLRRTYMKMFPTDEHIHGGNVNIDYNLYTLLEPFTFLAVLHKSSDGKWYYVHAPYMRGWVKKEDIVLSSREEVKLIHSFKFLVVLKDRLNLAGVEWGMGSRIPYIEKKEDLYRVLLPNGSTLWIKKGEELSDGFLKFSSERAKELLESLLGQPYGWGGLKGNRDCSSYVMGVFSVFGLNLPRNSSQQMLIGNVVANRFSSFEEMRELLKTLPPFRTLLFMKGHVMVYGGTYGDDIVVYHAVNSILTDEGSKLYVGKIVKNYLIRDRLTGLYRRIISVNVL